MAIPEGYSFLAKIGVAYKEDYDENVTYNQYDAVYYNGSTYIALVDSPVGPPTADGENWQYMAQGFLSQVISSLTATDKNGVIGEAGATVNAQNLIDGMSDAIGDKLDKDGDASDTTVTFEQASSRENIVSGEKSSTFRGKVKKWLSDMTAAAFMQIIKSNTDLMATTVAGYLVDALAVKQQFDVVNSNLSTLGNKASIESYSFNTSSDVTEDSYTVQHTGWAMLSYSFNQSEYSQFGLFINGANVLERNISSGNSTLGGTGVIPLYLQKGDIVRIYYYSTFRMSYISLRVRY